MSKFESLIKLHQKGFKKQVFYYAIPGDENDMAIWVKDSVVLAWNSSREYFVKCNYSELSYQHGFPWDYAVKADLSSL